MSLRGHVFLTGIVLIILTNSVANAHPCEKWQRISTPHYDILFLANIVREAQRMANTLEALYEPVNKTLHSFPKRTLVILRSQIAISNGLYTLAPPPRVEFFSFPPQDYNFLHSNDWLNLLAVHELRHVAQYESILQNYGFFMPAWLGSDIFTPAWLLEGDAVGTETALSTGGRGRIPHFEVRYKVNLLERGGFTYYQQVHGSFKDEIPNYYRLGYVMTTHLRRKYGADIISNLLQRKGLLEAIDPFLFCRKLKKFTGRTLLEIYQDANTELKTLWTDQLKDLPITPLQPLHNRALEDYVDYSYPQPSDQGIIVLKSGIGTVAHLARINENGQESKIFTPGSIDTTIRFTVAQNTIAWIEHMSSQRWEYKRYTAIQAYNFQTKKFKTLAYPSRYSSVALSPDGAKLVAFETDETYNHRLVLLDAEKGTLLHCFPNPENNYYLTPSWSADGRYLVVVKHVRNKSTITIIDLQTNKVQDILIPTNELIGCPVLHDSYVYYNSSYSGIDNIYAVHLQTQQRFQVTSSKYGAYNPAITADGKWLVYNDFCKNGMDAVRIPIDLTQWTPIENVQDRSIHYYEPLVAQENNAHIFAHIPDSTYSVEDHRPWENLVLLPYLVTKPPIGAALVLRNLWDTMAWKIIEISGTIPHRLLGTTKKSARLSTKFTYQGWYPIISIELGLSKKWKPEVLSKEMNLSLAIPFAWNFKKYKHLLILHTTQFNKMSHSDNRWRCKQNYTARLTRRSPKSPRDIHRPWGQTFLIDYTHTWYGRPAAPVFGGELKFFFPGLFNHHSLCIGAKQQYSSHTSSFMFVPLKIDYAFPIAYPDFEIKSFVFVRRLRASLLYDQCYQSAFNKLSHTVGAAFILDLPWFYIGLRCTYTFNAAKPIYALLLG